MTSSSSLLLNALYEAGSKMGNIFAYVFIFLMVIEIVYVFVRFVITSDK